MGPKAEIHPFPFFEKHVAVFALYSYTLFFGMKIVETIVVFSLIKLPNKYLSEIHMRSKLFLMIRTLFVSFANENFNNILYQPRTYFFICVLTTLSGNGQCWDD